VHALKSSCVLWLCASNVANCSDTSPRSAALSPETAAQSSGTAAQSPGAAAQFVATNMVANTATNIKTNTENIQSIFDQVLYRKYLALIHSKVCLFCACLSVCLSVCLPACLSVCMSVCMSVCLSVHAHKTKSKHFERATACQNGIAQSQHGLSMYAQVIYPVTDFLWLLSDH